jgi:hypothetical protein
MLAPNLFVAVNRRGSEILLRWRDIKSLQVKWKDANLETYEALVKSQLEALRQMEEGVVLGTVDAETARAWLAIRQEQAKLLGLNSDKDSPTFQLNVKGPGGKGPRRAIVELVAPPRHEPPVRGSGQSAPHYAGAEPLQLGAGDPEPNQEEQERAQRAEARAELRRKVGLS